MKKFLGLRRCHQSLYRQGLSSVRCTSSTSTSSGGETQDLSEVPKVFNPATTEKEILKKWERFSAKRRKKNEVEVTATSSSVFRMLLPPPNVTGKLHLGHFLTIAVEDTIARWKLMNGVNVDWIPGFDHAGIATQSVVTRKMSKQLEASDLGTTIEEFASSNLDRIREQLKTTGALLNWDETYYTLDEAHSSVVKEAFIQLFESGLINRADGIVNWSCALKTTVADIEVDEIDFDKKTTIRVPNYKDPVEFGVLYHIAYRFLDSDKEYLVVATSRPETMFGDVALAVNPIDGRYTQLIGKRVVSPLNGSVLPVIGDVRVKPDFGTGVVKITPAHDKLDFAIGSSQKLPSVDTFTKDGFLNESCGDFQGVPRFIARKKILELLGERGAIVEEKPYSGSVHVCSRSGDVIEPKLIPHWFLKTQFLSNKVIQAINDKSFMIVPENHSRSLITKLIESQDWCLSRQIQWGHKIPAFHHRDYPETWVAAPDVQVAAMKLEKILGCPLDIEQIVQDSDVLDTWFSSALIPLSVSGWPDSETFKEITLMETGHDILLFWVWRMVIMTLALVNRFPFRHVLLHGVVTDNYGRKMSKSRGNVIDPLHIINGISYKELVEETDKAFASGELDENEFNLRKVSLQRNHSDGFAVCGTDALRLTLLSQNIFDQEITLDLTYLDNCKRFSNKLWQALRFLKLHSCKQEGLRDDITSKESETAEAACKWILSCLYEFNKTAETSLNQAKFHLYAEAIRKFFYQELCDIYIELVKGAARNGSDISKYISIMQFAFETGMKIAHPMIPFVTEEIWSFLRNEKESSLLEQDFPSSKDLEHFFDPILMDTMGKAMHLTTEIRGVKRRGGWTSKAGVPQVYVELEEKLQSRVQVLTGYIQNLAGAQVKFGRHPQSSKGIYGTFLVDVQGYIGRIHIPLLEASAKSANQAKIEKLKLKLLKLQQQYESPSFQQFAPPQAKEKLKKKLETLIIQLNETNKSNPNRPSG